MSNRSVITSANAPKPIAPYSQAIKSGQTVYISGQLPIDPTSGTMVTGDDELLVMQCFKNIEAICLQANGSFADVVRVTVYLSDMSLGPIVNRVMEQLFTQPYPARVTIGVAALPMSSRIEVDAIAVVH